MFLMLFLYVSKRYCYCHRDEVVNEQFLVEDVYERELAIAEECERERQAEWRAMGLPERRPLLMSPNNAVSSYGTIN